MVRALTRLILETGLDDWVPLAAIDGMAERLGAPERHRRPLVLAAIESLLISRLVHVGELHDGAFAYWLGSPSDIVGRIQSIWESADPNDWGFAVWLSNTPEGDKAATSSSN